MKTVDLLENCRQSLFLRDYDSAWYLCHLAADRIFNLRAAASKEFAEEVAELEKEKPDSEYEKEYYNHSIKFNQNGDV